MSVARSRLAFIVALMLLTGCGSEGLTGGNRSPALTLVPDEASVTTQQVTTASITGARLTASSYNGALGTMPLIAGRVNDSTLSFVVPAAVAGSQTLSVTIGSAVVQATLNVAVVTPVTDPVKYVAQLDSVFNASITTSLRAAVNNPARTTADSAALTADLQAVRSARAVAQASFATLSPSDQQEVANILRATFDQQLISPRVALAIGGSASTGRIDSCLYKEIPKSVEEERDCQSKKLGTLERIRMKADDCRAAKVAASAVGLRAAIRTSVIQLFNFCHVARLTEYSAEQWEAANFTVTPTFPTTLQELFTPITVPFEEGDLRIGTPGSALSARIVSADVPMPFSHGIAQKLLPRVRFRPLISSDVGRIPAATGTASILNSLAAAWRALNSYSGGLLGREPATLATTTTPRSRAMRYAPEASLRLGRVQPQAIRWNWLPTTTGIELKFDIDDKSADVPFTYDLIYDAGGYGADTVSVNAVLTRDSVPIYTAAAVGFWSVTPFGANAVSQIFEMKPGGVATYRQLNPDSTGCSLFVSRYKDGACEYDVKWRVFSRDGRYFVEEFGFWNGYRGVPTAATFPITGYNMVVSDGTVSMRYRKL